MNRYEALRLVTVPSPSHICDRAERTLVTSLTKGKNVLVGGLLIKTNGQKPLGLGVERTEISGGTIEQATWYRVVGPSGAARAIQNEFVQNGIRWVDLTNGKLDLEETRPLYRVPDLYGEQSPEVLMEGVRSTADAIRTRNEIVVVDLSKIDEDARWIPS